VAHVRPRGGTRVSEPLPEHALRKLLAVAAAGEGGPPVPADPAAPLIPPRYRILGELGRGGMGVVYEAYDEKLERKCALKMIGAAAGAHDELRRRFAREALAAARLRHPHIASIYDATPDYISMQLVAGRPIDSIDAGDRRLLVDLLRDAARALHHAHSQGIVHRDLKPSNLLVEGRHVFVVDFGLAKEIETDAARSTSGAVLGTPAFMPPEQAQGGAIDARSDVYSLGATLYRCLTGEPPFADADLGSLLRRVVEDEPRPPGIERDLDLVVLKCLEKEPGRRYATAEALALDLERWLRSEPVEARRPSFGYRLRKLLQRRKSLLRAAAAAALAAMAATALVLVPIALRESAARVAAGEAVELSELAAGVLQDAAVYARLGDLASANQALEAGIAKTREFLSRHDVARMRHLLSRLLRARSQPDLAFAELEAALERDPSLDEARFERGLMLAARPTLTESERASAVADLSTPIRERSVLTGVDLLFGRAERLRLEGRPEEAMETLNEVLAYDPTHVAARASLAKVALALGEDDLARQYAISAVDLQQGYGPIYLARERRTLPTAILGLDAALVDFAPQLADGLDNSLALAHRGLVHLRRAIRLEAEGNRVDAIASVQSAVEDHDAALVLHPDVAGALNNRAVCLMQADRLQLAAGDSAATADARARAEADLARATALDPRLPEARFNSGVISLRTAELLRRLGRAAAAARRIDAALDALRRAEELAPAGWPHLRACRAKLAEAEAARRAAGG
jgi:tetratricopeptide (TPR) repeat protein/predicted Ser/Thr protein kinase